jgi:hypothetical protein
MQLFEHVSIDYTGTHVQAQTHGELRYFMITCASKLLQSRIYIHSNDLKFLKSRNRIRIHSLINDTNAKSTTAANVGKCVF